MSFGIIGVPSLSKKYGPLQFGGLLSPFAAAAAYWTLRKAIESQSRQPFFAVHPAVKAPCLIVPQIAPDRASFTLLYGLRREAMKPGSIASGRIVDGLEKRWRKICRSFVKFEITDVGEVIGIDHDATVRAASELLETRLQRAPSLEEIDAALGTSLEMLAHERAKTTEENVHVINDFYG